MRLRAKHRILVPSDLCVLLAGQDPQQAGGNRVPSVNTTTVFDNIAVNPNGNFYSCASPLPLPWWNEHGNRFWNNSFFTPGSPSLPFKVRKPDCWFAKLSARSATSREKFQNGKLE